jgi:hypothetical protein
MVISTADRIYVQVTDGRLIDQALDEAVSRLASLACERRHGILVNRLAPGSFIVAASADVPVGQSHEQSMW